MVRFYWCSHLPNYLIGVRFLVALDLLVTLKEPQDLFSERITTKVAGHIVLHLDVVDRTSVDGSLTSGWKGAYPGQVIPYMIDSDATHTSSDRTSQSSNQAELYQAVEALTTRLKTLQQLTETLLKERPRDRLRVIVSGGIRVDPFLGVALKVSSALFSVSHLLPSVLEILKAASPDCSERSSSATEDYRSRACYERCFRFRR